MNIILLQLKISFEETQSSLAYVAQKLLPTKLSQDDFKKIYEEITKNTISFAKSDSSKIFLDFNSKSSKTLVNTLKNKIIPDLDEIEIAGVSRWEEALLYNFFKISFPFNLTKLVLSEDILNQQKLSSFIDPLKLLSKYNIESLDIIGFKISAAELVDIVTLSTKMKHLNILYCELGKAIDFDFSKITYSNIEQIKIFSKFSINCEFESHRDLLSTLLSKISESEPLKQSLKEITFRTNSKDYDHYALLKRGFDMPNIKLLLM